MEKRKHTWAHCTVATTLFRGPPSSSLWFCCNPNSTIAQSFYRLWLTPIFHTHPLSIPILLLPCVAPQKTALFLLCFAYVFGWEEGFFCFVCCKVLKDWSFWSSVSICCCLCAFLERALLDLTFFLPLSFPVEVLVDLNCWVLVRWRDRDGQKQRALVV